MVFRWAVNAGLLAIPIGATVGILIGIDSHRSSTGQAPLFNGDDGSGIGGGIGSDNGITDTRYCQRELGISPPSTGAQYTLNPNQWGWTEGEPGALCMNISSFHNQTYATKTTAPKFSVTWQYPPGQEDAPVHAFPHIQVDSSVIPLALQSVKHINLDMHWTYGVGNQAAASTDAQALTQNLVNTNVAIDMFLDNDKTKAQNASEAKYEVMVWFADFGAAAQPIGLEKGIVATQILNGITFNLYTGQNGLQQTVLTWLASKTTEVFNGDIAPLLSQLYSSNHADFPAGTSFLGYLGLGSEAFSATANVTFSMPLLSIDVQA